MRREPPFAPAPAENSTHLYPTPFAWCSGPDSRRGRQGFTLVELLGVMTIMAVLLTLVAPAFVQISGGRNLVRSAYDISGLLEGARAYAKANSTYTWVGFYEEDPSQPAGTTGTGRVVVSVVASKDATAMYTSADINPPVLNPANLVQINKLVKLDNVHLDVLTKDNVPNRDTVPVSGYQVGSDSFKRRPPSDIVNQTTFTYPVAATAPTYTFTKIIQFNPIGDATKIVDTPTQIMEIGLRPARGNVADANTKSLAALQIAGIGGAVRLYQP